MLNAIVPQDRPIEVADLKRGWETYRLEVEQRKARQQWADATRAELTATDSMDDPRWQQPYTQPLHYPGGLTDAQWARFAGRGENANRVIYEWHRTTETGTAKTFPIGTFETPTCDILAALHEQAQARNPERTDWTPSPAYKPAVGRGLSQAQVDFERAGQEWEAQR